MRTFADRLFNLFVVGQMPLFPQVILLEAPATTVLGMAKNRTLMLRAYLIHSSTVVWVVQPFSGCDKDFSGPCTRTCTVP